METRGRLITMCSRRQKEIEGTEREDKLIKQAYRYGNGHQSGG